MQVEDCAWPPGNDSRKQPVKRAATSEIVAGDISEL
jgi:hypothetical protein